MDSDFFYRLVNKKNKTFLMEKIQTMMISLLPTIQLYHWHTTSYARHQASGAFYEEMSELIDQFMEVLLGHYRRRVPYAITTPLEIPKLTHTSAPRYLRDFDRQLATLDSILPNDSLDLLTLRDEMSAAIHRTLFLFAQS